MFRPDARAGQPLLHGAEGDQRGRTLHPSSRRAAPTTTRAASSSTADATASAALIPRTPTSTNASTPIIGQPSFSRRQSFRSRSPAAATGDSARAAARRRYTYAAAFLAVSLVAFTVQTELAAVVQHDLGWDKAYCMLYLTHGSWALLWPAQLAVLRLRQRDVPWPVFWRRHVWLLRTTAYMVERQDTKVLPYAHGHGHGHGHGHDQAHSPWPYMLRTTAFVTVALTVAGLSWYVAVSMTTPSDLTAIYHCSAFFAYAFSVPLLKERLRLDKCLAVAVAIAGVLVVAYGDAARPGGDDDDDAAAKEGSTRFVGNMVIGAGSVLYGLYEVLYKRFACPPDGTSPGRGMVFANAFGSLIGLFTLLVLWVPLPVLHWLGWETFALPTGRAAWLLFASVLANATFAGAFLVLVSLTSPVLGSVAALLTIFIVAAADWCKTGEPPGPAALLGGLLIIAAFAMLSWSTWREMAEEAWKRALEVDGDGHDDDDDDDDETGAERDSDEDESDTDDE